MKLSEVCEFIVDCPHSTAKNEGDGYPLIRTPNIGKGRLILEEVHRVSEQVYNKRNVRAVPMEGDLIFAREAPAGNVAIIKENQKVCLGQRTVLIRPNKKIVNSDFLVYYLLAPKQQYELLGTANGATVAHVNLPIIRNLPIILPEKSIQDKIASILSAYDDLIENSQKQIKLLEEAVQRLYKEWFVDLRFPGFENTEIVDGVPRGWKKGVLGDIAVFKRGKTITKAQVTEGEVPVVAGGLEPAYYHNKANTVAPVITVSASGANAGFSRLYNVDVFASDCSFVDSETTPYIYFVYCFVKDNKSSFDILQKGSAQPHVYAKDVNALELLIPAKDKLEKFCKYATSYFEKIKTLQRQIKLSLQARDRLLPKLMSGEIEV
ncbi:MAG: restriction endonuclease subunit S [Oscillospiraceae bacterium]